MFLLINEHQQILNVVDTDTENYGNGVTFQLVTNFEQKMVGSKFVSAAAGVVSFEEPPDSSQLVSTHSLINGNWVDNWEEADHWFNFRIRRGVQLTKTDWTQTLDAPLSIETQTAWKLWREQIRELPQNHATVSEAETALETLLSNKPV